MHLFGLQRILKYKKGKLAERHLELTKLYQYIVNILPTLEPALNFNIEKEETNFSLAPLPFSLQGAALKAVEDRLDSLICAYVAAHWWYWGLQRNWVLGDRTTGYIVVPASLPIESVYLNNIRVISPEN